MFFNHPRRTIGSQHRRPDPFLFRHPRHEQRREPSNVETVINMFRDDEGKVDINKILYTADQLNDVYKQLSSVVNNFRKK